ncbi:MAG: UDP-N-acetylmuramoyl-L-alanine--D-glutamate ligase [Deltaproteobacteria bacterium]|jgi:UDP-N-acetylmuramoylalanine--D-glutamate ligase|nr:UDP-N-acetylmuramoyl-L-alanine--D-glutamate ligase [Deltaproteobacteria bacterium]
MFKEVSELKDKRILVVGLGKTGVSLCHFLSQHGAQVTVTDHKSKPELSTQLELLDGLPIKFELGSHSPKTFLQQDLVVLSPGVSPILKIFEYARNQGIKITGEFEFAQGFIKEPIVGITGTNGKTAVARMMESMLKESGISCWVGGSNEKPLTDYLRYNEKAQVVIIEVSSFMLEHAENFNPNNIVFTNLAENHLDRYRSMEEYINAKRRVFRNTNQMTTSILNADDNAVVELARDPAVQRGKIFYFSRKQALEPQIMNIGGAVNIGDEIRVRTGPEVEYYSLKNVKIRGKHNIENLMAAILTAREYGAKKEAIQKVIETFSGLPHRIEYVRKVRGAIFYNDSKATNVHAVLRSLDTFDENVILIMGGKDTNLNYEPLRNMIKRKVKTLILVGEAKERINRELGDFAETFLIGTFEEAVLISFHKTRIGDIVLLSPGCSSHDMFDSYAERGDYFKEIIRKFQ